MIGEYVQNYKVVSHLGEGGMGVVYKAVDNVLGREVALKMLHTSMIRQPQVLERFKKEAQVLARLLHPNIAVIYNFIEQDGQYFMVMEYIEGKNLDAIVKAQRALPYKTTVAMLLQALEGLSHAHKKGIIHRDIKPSNLILTPEGTVKLMDFGIAKIAGEQKLTQANRVIGTVEFMAPEIIEGREPSIATDIYATGITIYELLSGQMPFTNTSDYGLMQDILKKRPAQLSALNTQVPAALSNIIMKALEKKPENRFRDAKEFQQALLAAFPACKDLDLSSFSVAAQPIYETRLDIPTTGGHPTIEAIRETKESRRAAATALFQRIESKVLLNSKAPFIMAGIGFLVFLLVFLFIKINNRHHEPLNNDTVKSKTDSTAKVAVLQQENIPSPISQEDKTGTPVVIQPAVAEKKPATDDKPVLVVTDHKTAKKDEPKKTNVPETPVKPDPKPEPPAPVKTEKKEIYLDDKLEINLSMRETITREADDKDQDVTFVVTSPVVYQGITIVRQGAIARGNIKIGRVVSAVSINAVTAANGQELAITGHEHRKVKKLADERLYSAYIPRGIKMTFILN